MSNLKRKATKTIDSATGATKKATCALVHKSKDLIHAAGQKLQDGGKLLKRV